MPVDVSPLTITAESPGAPAGVQLVREMCLEIEARYGSLPSPFFPEEAQAPRTTFLVARWHGEPVGCGALRRLDDSAVELKRMYVAPSGRRKGIARRLLRALEKAAAGFGDRVLRLETAAEFPEAIALYESSGYARIPAFGRYADNPRSICFEKTLPASTANITQFDHALHRDQVVTLWKAVFGYQAPHNAPEFVIAQKMEAGDGLFFVALTGPVVAGTVMAGYDGHRGWLYSLAVSPAHRQQGIGSRLVAHAEEALRRRGCAKINLQVVAENESVVTFYQSIGYGIERRISLGKLVGANPATRAPAARKSDAAAR